MVLIELGSGALASVEINVNVQFGYQVTTEAVMERGVAEIGRTAGLTTWRDGRWGGEEHVTFKTRFGAAFDTQIQHWVDAVHRGTIDGASAWDGYLAAAACEAGVEAQRTGRRVEVTSVERPAFYDPPAVGHALGTVSEAASSAGRSWRPAGRSRSRSAPPGKSCGGEHLSRPGVERLAVRRVDVVDGEVDLPVAGYLGRDHGVHLPRAGDALAVELELGVRRLALAHRRSSWSSSRTPCV